MGFKSLPWKIYYKPSLGEFVIRQKHTNHTSENVKAINDMLVKAAAAGKAPSTVAHNNLVDVYGRKTVKYFGGTRYEYYAVPIQYMRAELRKVMAQTVHKVDGFGGVVKTLPIKPGAVVYPAPATA